MHDTPGTASRACGLLRKAIAKGIRELASETPLPPGRVRRRDHEFFELKIYALHESRFELVG